MFGEWFLGRYSKGGGCTRSGYCTFCTLPGGVEHNHDQSQMSQCCGRESNWAYPEYMSRTCTLQQIPHSYLNRDTFSTSMSSFKENLPGFFPWNLPVVTISPELVTVPEQGKSSGRIATFSLWTGMFRDGISSIPGETVYTVVTGWPFPRLQEQGIPREGEDDCWVG